jgi:hypothetical protein
MAAPACKGRRRLFCGEFEVAHDRSPVSSGPENPACPSQDGAKRLRQLGGQFEE